LKKIAVLTVQSVSYLKALKISLFGGLPAASLSGSMSSIVPRHFPVAADLVGRGNDVGVEDFGQK
jgi:hypothetical protein